MKIYTDTQIRDALATLKALDVLAQCLPESPFRGHVEDGIQSVRTSLMAFENVSIAPLRTKT